MGLIKDKGKYPIKENPIFKDYFIGSDSSNGGKTVNFEIGKIVSLISTAGQQNKIISGSPVWIPDTLSFYIPQITYIISGELHYTSPTTITLDNGGTQPRIDVIAVTINDEVYVQKGVESPTPQKPTLPNGTDYLELTFVNIASFGTVPDGVSLDLIYDENSGEPSEYTATENTGGNGITLGYVTPEPFLGTKVIRVLRGTLADGTMTFTNDSTVPFNVTDYIQLAILKHEVFNPDIKFEISLLDDLVPTTNKLTINTSVFGFDNSVLDEYQLLTIPFSYFTNSGVSFNKIQIKITNIPYSEVFLDRIVRISGLTVNPPIGDTNLGYIAESFRGTVTSSTGTPAYIPLVDLINAGLMSPSDKNKLDNADFDIVEDQIVDGVVNKAPSQNIVFDSLLLKADDANVLHKTGNETKTGNLILTGNITANQLIKIGGTASQFLKADGSVDSNIYALDSNVVHLTGSEIISNGIKTITNTSTAQATFRFRNEIGAVNPTLEVINNSSLAPAFRFRSNVDNSVVGEIPQFGNNTIGLRIEPNQNNPVPTATMLVLSNKKAGNGAVDTATPLLVLRDSLQVAKIDDFGNISGGTGTFTGNVIGATPTLATHLVTKAYADGLVVGLLDDRGSYNASVNVFPSTGGSGTSGAILKGDIWYVSVAGTLGGKVVAVGDSFRALVDSPAQVASNWGFLSSNIGYVPANDALVVHLAGTETITGLKTFTQAVTANSFVKSGGTASQFLKADGSVDSSVYALDSNTVHKTGNEVISGLKSFVNTNADISAIAITTSHSSISGITVSNIGSVIGGIQGTTSSTGGAFYGATTGVGSAIIANNSQAGATGLLFEGTNISRVFSVDKTGVVTAVSFVKSGGTATQFLKADGSIDSNVYAVDSTVVHRTGNLSESINGTKTFTDATYFDAPISLPLNSVIASATRPTLGGISGDLFLYSARTGADNVGVRFKTNTLTSTRTHTAPNKDGTYSLISQTITSGVTENSPSEAVLFTALDIKTENSAGAIQGFAVTNNGNGTVNIASGTAYLRATNDPYTPLVKYTIPAVTNLALTDNANNFVLVDYNGGVPALTVTTNTATINTETNSLAIVISRVGTVLDYLSLVGQNVDANAKLRVRFLNQEGIRRANGASIGFLARNLTLTSGTLFSGLIRINTPAFNTSTVDTFTQVYFNGTSWVRTTGQTQVNNTQYNSGGVLTNLGNNDYRTDYIYLLPNNPSKLYLVLGTSSYANITVARTAPIPTSLPSELQSLGLLVGRVIIQRLGANITEASSAFDVVFSNSSVPNHNDLAGIQGGAIGDYQHLTTAEKALVTGSIQGAGTGTVNFIPKFIGTGTIGNSQIFDNGTNVGFGTTTPQSKLSVNGDIMLGIPADLGASLGKIVSRYSGSSSFLNSAEIDFVRNEASSGNGADIVFRNSNGTTFSEKLRIAGNGNLLVGTSTDNGVDKLQVNGTISTKGISIPFISSSSPDAIFTTLVPTGTHIVTSSSSIDIGFGTGDSFLESFHYQTSGYGMQRITYTSGTPQNRTFIRSVNLGVWTAWVEK